MREALSARIVESIVSREEVGSYSDYLKTAHWSAVKAAVRHAYGSQCRVCRSKKDLHVHHRTYANLGKECWNDLELLCEKCYDLYHASIRVAP